MAYLFSDEQIRESAPWLSGRSYSIVSVNGGDEYYDPGQKKFFFVCADGDYAHGYDVTYPQLRKETALNSLLDIMGLYHTWEKCRNGEIPLEAQLDLSEEAPEDAQFTPEKDFGYGLHFM